MNEFSSPPQLQSSQQNPISLAMLFYMVTVAAILLGCYRYIAPTNATGSQYLAASLLGAFIGFFAGAALILRKANPMISSALGMLVGASVGPVLCIRAVDFGSILLVTFVGGWLMVLLVCLAARKNSRQTSG